MVVEWHRATVDKNKVGDARMGAAKSEQSYRIIGTGQKRNTGSTNPRMRIQFLTIEYRTVVRNLIELLVGNMNLASEQRIGRSVMN